MKFYIFLSFITQNYQMSSSQVSQQSMCSRNMMQMENMVQKTVTNKSQQLMDCLRNCSYKYSHCPDEVTRTWLLLLLDVCETFEATKEQFGMPACLRDYEIQRDDSYVNQVSETCDAVCSQIRMISERVKELNCKNRKKWWTLMDATLQEIEQSDLESDEEQEETDE